MTLTAACVFVRGEYPYTLDYVTRLRAMVQRWIDRPFRFVCLTDQPELMPPGVEPVAIAKLPGLAFWSKLELFNPARDFTGRVLYLDLDTLIVDHLDAIVDYPAPFAITADPVRPGQRTVDRFGRAIVRRFNSSVMVWDAGTQDDLFTEWSPAVADRISGDQCWIGERKPDAAAMPREWFPRISELREIKRPAGRVVLVKHPKNHLAVREFPWIAPLWGAA